MKFLVEREVPASSENDSKKKNLSQLHCYFYFHFAADYYILHTSRNLKGASIFIYLQDMIHAGT